MHALSTMKVHEQIDLLPLVLSQPLDAYPVVLRDLGEGFVRYLVRRHSSSAAQRARELVRRGGQNGLKSFDISLSLSARARSYRRHRHQESRARTYLLSSVFEYAFTHIVHVFVHTNGR